VRPIRLLLAQHLNRQLSQPGIALSTEHLIFRNLPGELQQTGLAEKL
jgi:hypothetical protein